MAITYVGAASAAAANNVNLPTFQAGDVAIVVAARWDSTTAPLAAPGWRTTTIGGGTLSSARVGIRVLQAGDTNTGSWLNAQKVGVAVYRGVDQRAPLDVSMSGVLTETATTNAALTQLPGIVYPATVGVVALLTEQSSGTAADAISDDSPLWTNRTSGGNDYFGVADSTTRTSGAATLGVSTRQVKGWFNLRAASTFPQVSDGDTTSGTVTTNSTSWTLTYPTNLQSGDLILALVATDGDTSGTTPPTGFFGTVGVWNGTNYLASNGASNGASTLLVWSKTADGTESGSFAATLSASEQGAWRVMRVVGWSGLASVNCVVGASATPDPRPQDPTIWDIEDTLWIAVMAADTSRTVTGYPADTTDNDYLASGGTGGATLGWARREYTAQSWDPSAFTISSSDDWATATIAIRPAAAAPPPSGDTPIPAYIGGGYYG